MTRVRAQVRVDPEISIVALERLWYDLDRWPAFVDGFAAVAERDAGWPREGTLVWDTNPGGRGRVVERVTRFEARVGQDVEVEDPRITGTQRVCFGRGLVALELEYRLKAGNPVLDLLFIRRAMRDSLQRTLNRFAVEVEGSPEVDSD